MKKLFIGIFILLCLFSCAKKENSKILVTIDKEKITMEEFNKELDKIPMNMKMAVATESGKKNYLDRLIMKKLLLMEANKDKIENEKEFQTRLIDIKEQLLIESLLKKKISSDSQLNDEELKKYYDANKDKFKKGEEINTRHILLKTAEEAKQIKEKLQNGEDFVELAKKYSIDPNAKTTGGEIGFHPKGAIFPEYEEAAFKLTKVGQISSIVKTQYGYHIIRLEGTKPPAFVSFDEVKDFIKQQLVQEKQKELVEKYIGDLKKNAKITIDENLLKEDKPVASEKPENQDKTGKESKTDTSKEQQKTDAPATHKK
jgi:peptidyl-prolyl cis-trans isomerase C